LGRVRRLRIVAVQAAIVFVLLEVSLRLLAPANQGLRGLLYRSTLATNYDRVATLPDLLARSWIGWKPKTPVEGFVLNSRGLRTREYAEAKAPGAYRVVVLGDSFAYGGVPDAVHWTSLLESGLAVRRGGAIEVLRFGVPGSGPPFALRLWQLEGRGLGADLVIHAFFVGNDFFDEQAAPLGGRSWSERLADLSYAFRAARSVARLRSGLEAPALGEVAGDAAPRETGGYELAGFDYGEDRPTFTEEAFDRIEAERLSLCLVDEDVRFAVRLDRTTRLLDALRLDAESGGARFLVAILPDEFQVDAVVLDRAARHAGRSPAEYDLERPQRRLLEHCRTSGLDCVDLLPAFRAAAPEAPLFRPRDTHWSRAGHALAARQLVRYLGDALDAGGAPR
jgi:hypothetical protein